VIHELHDFALVGPLVESFQFLSIISRTLLSLTVPLFPEAARAEGLLFEHNVKPEVALSCVADILKAPYFFRLMYSVEASLRINSRSPGIWHAVESVLSILKTIALRHLR
jgi:hypothetical protein